jgi:prepilin-type N-terminal cleavage/methylation domain-containing protein
MKHIRCDKGGFTLLELMIAIAIFAIAGIASLESYLLTMRHMQIITEDKNLNLLSRAKIEELKNEDDAVEEGRSGGFGAPFEKYTWTIELSDLIIADTEYGITFIPYKLRITAESGDYTMVTPFLKTEEEESLNETAQP